MQIILFLLIYLLFSIVQVEKHLPSRCLRFMVDGSDLVDKKGVPYGWCCTGLSDAEFASLVGAIQLYRYGDGVKILVDQEI